MLAVTVTGCLCVYVQYKQTCRHYSSLGGCIAPAACSLSPSYICFCPGTPVRMEPCGVSLGTTSTSVYAWETLVRIEPCSVCLGTTGLLSQCLYDSNTLNIGLKIVPLLQYCRSYIDIVQVWLKKSLSKKQFVYLQEIVLFHRPVTKFQLFQVSRCLAAVWRRILDSSIHAY